MMHPRQLCPSGVPGKRPTIYLIGVPAAGKTTLITGLARRLRSYNPLLRLGVVTEVARELILHGNVSPMGIKAGTDDGMKLQRQILEAQLEREATENAEAEIVLSDRSGLDPIVFATQYGPPGCTHALLELKSWVFLRERMQHSLVILCEPNWDWYVDDSVRIKFESMTDMNELHAAFIAVLRSQAIGFEVLPASPTDLNQRVDLVVGLFERYYGQTV